MTPAGIVMALAAIFVSMMMDHGKPMTLISIPSMVLVFGGTIGVSAAGVNKHDLKSVRGAFRTAIKNKVTWHASDFNQHLLAAGAEHSLRILRLADRCNFSWVRDPSGNWIEMVQYARLSGPLPPVDHLEDHWDEVERWRQDAVSY